MGVLDSLKSIFGGSTEDSAPAPLSAPIPATTPTGGLDSGIITAPVGPKGSKATFDATSSEQILKKMQDYLDQRTGPKADFNSGLLDALAAGSSASPYGAMQQRQNAKLNEKNDILSKQMEIAQFRAAQELQKNEQANWNSKYGSIGQGSAGGTGSGGSGSINGISPDVLSRAAYLRTLGPEGIAEANKMMNTATLESDKAKVGFQNSGPGRTQQTYTIKTPNGVIQQDLDPTQWAQAQQSGKLPDGTPILAAGPTRPNVEAPNAVAPNAVAPNAVAPNAVAPNANDVATVESNHNPNAIGPYVPGQGRAKGEMQVMDRTAIDPGFGVKPAQLTGDKDHDNAELAREGRDYHTALVKYYGDATLGTAAYNWGPDNMDKWLANGADISKLPADVRDYVGKAYMAHALSNRQPQAAPAQAAPAQAAPAQAAPVALSGPNEARVIAHYNDPRYQPQNNKEFEKQKADLAEAQKADIAAEAATHAARLKGTASEYDMSGKAAGKMTGLAQQAPEVIAAADAVINHATTHPEEFGYMQQKGFTAPILAALSATPKIEGAVEKVLSLAHPSVDEAGTTQAQRRSTSDSNAQKLGLHYAAEMFAGSGARLGFGLEKMAADAKGVGTQFPAPTNIANAKLIKLAAQKSQDMAPLWDAYQKADTSGEAKYSSFLQSPQARAVEAKWDPAFKAWVDDTKKSAPGYYNSLLNTNQKKPDINSFFKKDRG